MPPAVAKRWSYGSKLYDCPIVLALDRLKGRWKTNILWYIWHGTNRFNAICRELPQVNRGVVAKQLRQMERDRLVVRHVVGERPLHVEYTLTDLSTALFPALEALANWGTAHGTVHVTPDT